MRRYIHSFAIVSAGLCSAASPQAPTPAAAAPVECVVLTDNSAVRLALQVDVDGQAVPTLWAESFARIFAFHDRDGNGVLDAREAAHLPSALALRQAMGNGFTPPIGKTPPFSELDRNGDGKVVADELSAYYRAAGLGNALVGAGRLPASADLAQALLQHLDTNHDGRVTETEWQRAADTLQSLDRNGDELIGAGELLPKTIYPGAAGTMLLTPPQPGQSSPESVTPFPVIVLPEDPNDRQWATEIARRHPRFARTDLLGLRQREPTARWTLSLGKTALTDRQTVAASHLLVEAWTVPGKAVDAAAHARQFLTQSFEKPIVEPKDDDLSDRRRISGSLHWLTPTADRNQNGKLDRDEFDAWLALQDQIIRGQVLLTILDNGGLFELLDTNHDGSLSVRELRTAWARVQETGCVNAGAYDPQKQPRLLLIVASAGYPQQIAQRPHHGPAWFRAMDKNRDGDVSRREFTGPARVFDTLDTDQDGLLTASEAEQARKP